MNVTSGNQISHSFSWRTDCCDYIRFRTGVGCWMWQEIQMKTFLHLLSQQPLYSHCFLSLSSYSSPALNREVSFLHRQCLNQCHNPKYLDSHSSKSWSRNLYSNESCTVPQTHQPLMDLSNIFLGMFADCFSGTKFHIGSPVLHLFVISTISTWLPACSWIEIHNAEIRVQ